MPSMKTIADDCDENDGILQVTLGTLRDAVGAGKLGRWVLGRIAEELASEGLGYFPIDLLDDEVNDQPRQQQEIRIYRKGPGTIARAIEAVLQPTPRGDATLRGLGTNDAGEVLAQIRKLVAV
jgi:hypothetical protein